MRVLVIHQEARYFAGAEKMLGYFLEGLREANCETAVACVQGSRVAGLVPQSLRTIFIPEHARFSPAGLWRQSSLLVAAREGFPFDLAHGWAARDWELTALTGWRARRPALGTLHDHPNAGFHSFQRRQLMRWSARLGLRRIVCVSDAVQKACAAAGLAAGKLGVVRNGLPKMFDLPPAWEPHPEFRIGFLGAFSERKGLRELFRMLDELSRVTPLPWSFEVAGGAQDAHGRRYLAEIQGAFSQRAWWGRVRWAGWVDQPLEFLRSLDLLVCPSSEFDPFPTVLLEAGGAGVAVLAARVGGVEEIIQDGVTGWLYSPDQPSEGVRTLARLLAEPRLTRRAGEEAMRRVHSEFSISRMVAQYLEAYAGAVPQNPLCPARGSLKIFS
jgi:glycosyltransferase involved in cell wall biosynthesis